QPRVLQALRTYAAGLRADRIRPAAVPALARDAERLKALEKASPRGRGSHRSKPLSWEPRPRGESRASTRTAIAPCRISTAPRVDGFGHPPYAGTALAAASLAQIRCCASA